MKKRKNNEYHLMNNIIALSEASVWDDAKNEWEFTTAFYRDSGDYLLKTWVNGGDIYCIFYKKTKFYQEYLNKVGQCENDEDIFQKLKNKER